MRPVGQASDFGLELMGSIWKKKTRYARAAKIPKDTPHLRQAQIH